jgi:hypothetical protein
VTKVIKTIKLITFGSLGLVLFGAYLGLTAIISVAYAFYAELVEIWA